MVSRRILTATGPVDAALIAPPSKSVTHRALVVAAVASGESEVVAPLDADDTRRTLAGLVAMGVGVTVEPAVWRVQGAQGRPRGGGAIDLAASGTSARFLTALASVAAEPVTLDGTARLRERPMSELVSSLTALGASIEASPEGRLPIRTGGRAVRGGEVVVSGARSSQFASALLLTAAAFDRGLRLAVAAPRVSFSYVELTVQVLESFGVEVRREDAFTYVVPPQSIRGRRVRVEGDHSSASYLLAATAILGGRIRIEGLRRESRQPDARFLTDLASLGCKVEPHDGGIVLTAPGRIPAFTWDLTDAPDLAPTAAALAVFAEGPSTLTGISHLAYKESDRIRALERALTQCGAAVSLRDGALTIVPARAADGREVIVDVADDHRIAMALAVVGLKRPGITIGRLDVVEKSYPRFWSDLAAAARTES
jgi:3-phosphoshikimate 1-carboxyvinyltransferase